MANEKYYPKLYLVDVELNGDEGSTQGASVKLDRDFILTHIRHQLIDDGSGNPQPTQDGNYRISWSEQNTRYYYKGPIPMADAAYGSVRHGRWSPLSAPVKFDQHVTIDLMVVNTIARSNPWKLQIILDGLELPQKEG